MSARCEDTRVCDETSSAGARIARTCASSPTHERRRSVAASDTDARDAFATKGVARVARVVRRCERDRHATDRGKRAELWRAETEEVELLAGVGFGSVWRHIERPGDHTSVLTRRRPCRRRSRASDKESHVPFCVEDTIMRRLEKSNSPNSFWTLFETAENQFRSSAGTLK